MKQKPCPKCGVSWDMYHSWHFKHQEIISVDASSLIEQYTCVCGQKAQLTNTVFEVREPSENKEEYYCDAVRAIGTGPECPYCNGKVNPVLNYPTQIEESWENGCALMECENCKKQSYYLYDGMNSLFVPVEYKCSATAKKRFEIDPSIILENADLLVSENEGNEDDFKAFSIFYSMALTDLSDLAEGGEKAKEARKRFMKRIGRQ